MVITLFIFAIWILCGILAYGGTFAHFQRGWPRIANISKKSDRIFAIILAIFGPIGLFVTVVRSRGFKHGLLFKL